MGGYLHSARGKDDWQVAWSQQDLWTAAELAMLCCGWNPGEGMHHDQGAYNDALESIKRAVRAEVLPIESARWQVDASEAFYAGEPMFRPAAVTSWAKQRYPHTFPYGELRPDVSLPTRLASVLSIVRDADSSKAAVAVIRSRHTVSQRTAEAWASLCRSDEAIAQDGRARRQGSA